MKSKNPSVGQASRLSKVERVSPPLKVEQASRLSEHSWIRHLPHFLLSGSYYFITFATYSRKSLQSSQKDCVFDAIRFLDGKKYDLYAVVVLDDHVHMVINPQDILSKIMHSIKSFTAHEINKTSNKKGKLWQDENFDRIIRNEKEFLEKINYIVNNPIKIDLATKIEWQRECQSYKWLYVKGWINDNL